MIAAVVPAAGASSRLGQPKLLLAFDGQTVIGRLVASLRAGGVERVVVIAPPSHAPEGPAVATEARFAGADVVVPLTRPDSMRDSVELGIARLAQEDPPQRVLLTPGDYPGLSAAIVAQVVRQSASSPECIVIPSHHGRRGHPIILPWRFAAEIPSLPADVGVNALVARHGDLVVELEIASRAILADLDTPDDLDEWARRRYSEGGCSRESGQPISDASVPSPYAGFESPVSRVPLAGSRFRVPVRLFALAKERAGRSEIEIDLVPGSTVRDVRTALADNLPALAPMLSIALVAVDEEYAGDETPVLPGSRLAVIPPVSGGAGAGGLRGEAMQ